MFAVPLHAPPVSTKNPKNTKNTKAGTSRCGLVGRRPCGRRHVRDDHPETQAPRDLRVFVFPGDRLAQPRAARSDQTAFCMYAKFRLVWRAIFFLLMNLFHRHAAVTR